VNPRVKPLAYRGCVQCCAGAATQENLLAERRSWAIVNQRGLMPRNPNPEITSPFGLRSGASERRVSKGVGTCASPDAPLDGARDRLRDGRSEAASLYIDFCGEQFFTS